jgi:acyl dehydratase
MLASRRFELADQARFAGLSGDRNPMHMDPIAARRTQAGAPVVHGIHTLLWLLNSIGSRHPEINNIATLKVRFPKMVYLGDQVEAEITQLTTTTLRARASVEGIEVVSIVASLGALAPASQLPIDPATGLTAHHEIPADLALQDMQARSGRIAFATPPAEMAIAFPSAAHMLGAHRVAALGCSTYLVGMVVPGLHSIFSGLELTLTDDTALRSELQFAVMAIDARFRRVKITLNGPGLWGHLETFSRVPPVAQLPIAEVAEQVASDEFRAATALVVGGSRGLGELTAKLIAAGGGRVIITYASGQADAARVAAEIGDWGGNCDVIAYDARQAADRQLEALQHTPTQLYYFATPPIAKRSAALFASEQLAEFNEFYVDGFLQLVEGALRRAPNGIAAFYPSSVYVQDRPRNMTEYAMSKAAGEILCTEMARSLSRLRVLVERLPRLPTDQTASLIQVDDAGVSPLSVMLPIVRKMHELQFTAADSRTA